MPKFDRWASDVEKFKAMVGLKVLAVDVKDDRKAIMVLSDGTTWTFEVEGDCCSNSYFAHPEEWGGLDGAIIQAVESRIGGNKTDEKEDHLQWNFLVFITNMGHISIQHNNSSNGYYSGEWIITCSE